MEQKRIEDYMAMTGYNLKNLASDVGLSISLLSKIKNGKEPVSKNTQNKFQRRFPGFELINGNLKWKAMYEEEKARNVLLADDYARVTLENEELRKRIDDTLLFLRTGKLSYEKTV